MKVVAEFKCYDCGFLLSMPWTPDNNLRVNAMGWRKMWNEICCPECIKERQRQRSKRLAALYKLRLIQ